jgi:uncharacterized Zn finger protein
MMAKKIPLSEYRSASVRCPRCGNENRAAFDVMQEKPVTVYDLCRNLACGALYRATLADPATMAVTVELAETA